MLGYTKVSFDFIDDDVANRFLNALSGGASYVSAWYQANAAIYDVSDRWAGYVREGGAIVEYSARSGRTPTSAPPDEAYESLGRTGRLLVSTSLRTSAASISEVVPAVIAFPGLVTSGQTPGAWNSLHSMDVSAADAELEALEYMEEYFGEVPLDATLEAASPLVANRPGRGEETVGYLIRYTRVVHGLAVRGNRVAEPEPEPERDEEPEPQQEPQPDEEPADEPAPESEPEPDEEPEPDGADDPGEALVDEADEIEDAIEDERDNLADDQATQMDEEPVEEEPEPVIPVYFLETVTVAGERRGRMVIINANTDQVVSRSEDESIRSRRLVPLGDGYLVVAGGAAEVGYLTLFDPQTLEPTIASEEAVYVDGVVEVRTVEGASEVFAVMDVEGEWYLGRFAGNLDLIERSRLAVNPDTSLAFTKDTVYAQGSEGLVLPLELESMRVRQ